MGLKTMLQLSHLFVELLPLERLKLLMLKVLVALPVVLFGKEVAVVAAVVAPSHAGPPARWRPLRHQHRRRLLVGTKLGRLGVQQLPVSDVDDVVLGRRHVELDQPVGVLLDELGGHGARVLRYSLFSPS